MKHPGRTAIVLGALAVVVVAFSIALPMLNRAREAGGSPKCSSNLRQLGQALTIYANDHEGRLPDSLEEMLASVDVTNDVMICPSSNDEIAPRGEPSEIIANIRARGLRTRIDEPQGQPRHCSYIYLGKGLSTGAITPATVLIVEPLANHDGDGINVLYGDGRVDFITTEKAKGLSGLLGSAPATAP